MKWHVIHTKVREEFGALENLQAQGVAGKTALTGEFLKQRLKEYQLLKKRNYGFKSGNSFT